MKIGTQKTMEWKKVCRSCNHDHVNIVGDGGENGDETLHGKEQPKGLFKVTIKEKPKPYIYTASGKAVFVRTEIEDANGNWKDSGLTTKNGFWVIHRGAEHDVYEEVSENDN